MKRSMFNEIVGVLITAGHKDLAETVARSPLSQKPDKLKRLETDKQKQDKRDNVNKSYHEMSPADKEKKAEDRKKREQAKRIASHFNMKRHSKNENVFYASFKSDEGSDNILITTVHGEFLIKSIKKYIAYANKVSIYKAQNKKHAFALVDSLIKRVK